MAHLQHRILTDLEWKGFKLMAIFSNKIETAYYINPEQTDIEIIYWEDGQKFNHIIESDPSHPDYIAMEAEGYDIDTLIDRTAEYKRAHNAIFNQLVNERAKIIAEEMMGMSELKAEYAKTQEKVEQAAVEYNKTQEKLDASRDTIANIGHEELAAAKRSKNTIFEYILKMTEDKDELFKFKLWALELDIVSSSDKATKSALRKAKSTIEGFEIIRQLNS
jgi:hypothetical protein